jgi:hypothetical protein
MERSHTAKLTLSAIAALYGRAIGCGRETF